MISDLTSSLLSFFIQLCFVYASLREPGAGSEKGAYKPDFLFFSFLYFPVFSINQVNVATLLYSSK
jgi:hypothetical protein